MAQCRAADHRRVSYRLFAFCGVKHKLNLVVLQHIHDMWPTFSNFIHPRHRQTRVGNYLSSPVGGNNIVSQRERLLCHLDDLVFIGFAYADERVACGRKFFPRSHLSLRVGFGECLANAHDFACALHFWSENRVDAWEFVEREYRFFNGEVLWHNLGFKALFGKTCSRHTARCNLS